MTDTITKLVCFLSNTSEIEFQRIFRSHLFVPTDVIHKDMLKIVIYLMVFCYSHSSMRTMTSITKKIHAIDTSSCCWELFITATAKNRFLVTVFHCHKIKHVHNDEIWRKILDTFCLQEILKPCKGKQFLRQKHFTGMVN